MHNTQWALGMMEQGKHVRKMSDPDYACNKVGNSINQYRIGSNGIGHTYDSIAAFRDDWVEYIPEPEYVDYKEAFDFLLAKTHNEAKFESNIYFMVDDFLYCSLTGTRAYTTRAMLTEKKWILLPAEVSNE